MIAKKQKKFILLNGKCGMTYAKAITIYNKSVICMLQTAQEVLILK